MSDNTFIIGKNDLILITGASGFVGGRLVRALLAQGFVNLRCFTRPTSDDAWLQDLSDAGGARSSVEIMAGNLLSRADCARAMSGVSVLFHLATGRDGKSYPDAFMNAVVTTRNLLEASVDNPTLRRFVSISSFAVYSNTNKRTRRLLDETCPVEEHSELRGDAYCYAKVKQDEIVTDYGKKFGIPYVIVRPGYVLGPGKAAISSRVGFDTFGVFLHVGGSNTMPFTYVDNCADAIALSGLRAGVEGEVFNVVDDDLPTSRQFLRLYKKNAKHFRSIYVPHAMSYTLCYLWEWYSRWSEGQLPPAFNRRHWHAYWKRTRYSNEKLKARLGWCPAVSMSEGLSRCFASYRDRDQHA